MSFSQSPQLASEQKRSARSDASSGASRSQTFNAGEYKMEIVLLPPYYPKNLPLNGLFSDEKEEEHKEQKRFSFIKTPTKTIIHTRFGTFGKPKDKIKGNLLGIGRSSRVKIMEEKGTRILYAVKIQPDTVDNILLAEREIRFLKLLKRYKGRIVRKSPSKGINQMYTFMQLLPGNDLFHLMGEIYYQKLWNISLRRRIEICIAVLNAVREFHALGFWHRDLKLENLVYDLVSRQAFVTDFETAIEQNKEDKYYKGTERYRAPDVAAHFKEGFEVYALGKTLAAMLCCYRNEAIEPITLEDLKDFQQNRRENWTGITDFVLLEKIVILLNRMTGPKDEIRPTLNECITEISQVWFRRACEVSVEKVYLCDVAGFLKATANEKTAFFRTLKQAHEVWLLDTSEKGFTVEQMRQLQREMSSNHIILHDKIFRKPGAKPQELAETIKQEFQEPGRSFDYVEPTPLAQPKDYPIEAIKLLDMFALKEKMNYPLLFVDNVIPEFQKVSQAETLTSSTKLIMTKTFQINMAKQELDMNNHKMPLPAALMDAIALKLDNSMLSPANGVNLEQKDTQPLIQTDEGLASCPQDIVNKYAGMPDYLRIIPGVFTPPLGSIEDLYHKWESRNIHIEEERSIRPTG